MTRISDLRDLAGAFSAAGEPHMLSSEQLELPMGDPPLSLFVRLHNSMLECTIPLRLTVGAARRGALHAAIARINRTLPLPGFLVTRGGAPFFRAVAFLDQDHRVELDVVRRLVELCRRSVAAHAGELARTVGVGS